MRQKKRVAAVLLSAVMAFSAVSPAVPVWAASWQKNASGSYIGSDGSVLTGILSRGIDVSQWQQNINWSAVADDDIQFAMIGTRYNNAVHHGAMQREKGVGKVIVNVKREERSTRIDVIDNGPGMDYRIVQSLYGGEKVEHTGIGMMNVQQRLISLYGKSYGLQIVTSEEGTDVRMNIPDGAAGSAQQEKTIG